MVRSMSPAQCLKKESLHLQYILWQSQTSIRNVHLFLQRHLRKKKKKNTNHKGQNGTFASIHPRSPQLRPWGPAQRCAFSSLSRSQKTPWLANRHAPEKTHVCCQIRTAVIYLRVCGFGFCKMFACTTRGLL